MTTNRNRNKQSSDFINPRAQRQLEMAEKRSVAAQLRRSAAVPRAAHGRENLRLSQLSPDTVKGVSPPWNLPRESRKKNLTLSITSKNLVGSIQSLTSIEPSQNSNQPVKPQTSPKNPQLPHPLITPKILLIPPDSMVHVCVRTQHPSIRKLSNATILSLTLFPLLAL